MSQYTPKPNLLKERVILVTGAGRGIGKAVAKALAAHGATVVLLGKTVRSLEQVYDEIEDSGAPRPAIFPLDLVAATSRDYENLAATIEKELHRLDGILHNAGALGTLMPLEQYDVETWYQVMQVNLHSPFLINRACLPLMRRAADASIVLTTADVAYEPRAYWGAYGVSKYAVQGVMHMLAEELENTSAIRVNSINPGRVHTQLHAQAYPAADPSALPTPEDIVGPYLYLLGPDSAGVTGQSLDIRSWRAPGARAGHGS